MTNAKLSHLSHIAVACAGLLLCTGANSVDECMECHKDPEIGGKTSSSALVRSIHKGLRCGECHQELDTADLPHEDVAVKPVNCGRCHEKIAREYQKSLHGQAVQSGAKFAPRCQDCHGSHAIAAAKAPDSAVAKLRVPFVCGRCHKEGTPVTQTYDIPQANILTHFSESIHGEGLFKRGLVVTAVCTDCHTAHSVLPHTDPASSINKANVAKTCEKCHGLIEQVHQKVIRGELWAKEPNKVPVCIDCHAPHTIRRVYYELGMADRDCLNCHAKPDIKASDGRALTVDADAAKGTAHAKIACAQCHTGVSPLESRPCATIQSKVDCSICHAAQVALHRESIHGTLVERGDPNAPACKDCHGTHAIRKHNDLDSPTYPTRIPELCGRCHIDSGQAARRYKGPEHEIVPNYMKSIHGKGLLESGLVVTATCTDCHTAHHELPRTDPRSSIFKGNIAATCGTCHNGINEQFKKSIHATQTGKTDRELPHCNDCHSSHQIGRTDLDDFKEAILAQCGRCHQDVAETYFETFHGKVSKLGFHAAARCHDCHGAHDIRPPWDPTSHLSRDNIVATCGKCHPGSHRRFAGYLTHATHHDRDKYPILFYTFWFMSLLLLAVFSFFGIHTLMWLPRSLKERQKRKTLEHTGPLIKRFSRFERQLHVLVIVSFLGLALTGMTLKFSYLGWAQSLSQFMGGFESAGTIHRLCALITFFYFGAHLFDIIRKKMRAKTSWRSFLFGPGSMWPGMHDLREFLATVKWFIGVGSKPSYGRWTYWEKFDYLAVFWGVAIIGSTGLVLWFPEAFTWILPGWSINVATIIHSDEALLAAGFIFTVHFFNTHFRPEKFPMDPVIFTGRVSLEELRYERPREYEELLVSGELEQRKCEPLPPPLVRAMKLFGACALIIGLLLVVLILYAEIFGYR